MKHLVCSAFLACAGTLFAELPTPIAHWTFDDSENLGADAQNAHPLTALIASSSYATPAGIADGHLNGAVNLRRSSSPVGNAFWTEPAALPTGKNPFTVSAWIRPNGATSNNGYILCHLALESGVPNGFIAANRWTGWYLRFGGDGKLALCFGGWRNPPAASDDKAVVGAIPSGAYKDNKWHHVAIARGADGMTRLFWDGSKIGESTITYSVNAICRLLLGSYEQSNPYSGDYDEVKVWNESLTDLQIVGAYLEGTPGIDLDEDGRILLHAEAGEVVTNQVSYAAGAEMAKTGAGEVQLWQASGTYRGTVGVTNGLLRTGENGGFQNAAGFAVEEGATFEFGRKADYAASFAGTGTMRFSGQAVFNLTGDLSGFTGTWQNYAANVFFGTSSAPKAISPDSSLNVANGGFFSFPGDVSVASLSGEGILGGVALADGGKLTVGGADDATFAGRLLGKGSFVKNGAGELTLSGASEFTNVAVNAGTLALAGALPITRPGLCAAWNFDDADNLVRDTTPGHQTPLIVDAYGNPPVETVADGVRGSAVHIVAPNSSTADCFLLRTGNAVALPSGTSPFTVSFWIRPRGNYGANSYILRYSDNLTGNATNFSYTGWNKGWMIATCKSGSRLMFTYLNGWRDPSNATDVPLTDTALAPNAWHHIVGTRDGKVWKLYLDGAEVGSYTYDNVKEMPAAGMLQIGSYTCHSQPGNAIDADYDEVQLFDRAWTVDDVAVEFARRTPRPAPISLPAPLAHWTFDAFETDEHGRFFRDHSGTGWNFYEVMSGSKTVQCIDASNPRGLDVNGGAAYVDTANYGAFLRVGDHVDPRTVLASANPNFTLSIRLRVIDNNQSGRQVLHSFGSAQMAETCLRLTSEAVDASYKDNRPKAYRVIPGNVNSGDGWALEDSYRSNCTNAPWTTLTFVNTAAKRQTTVYRDGRLLGTYASNYGLVLDRILLFAGYYNSGVPSTYSGYAVDDLRVYTNLLAAVEVKALVYEQAGVKPAPLAQAAVTVASAAALQVKDGEHVADTLVGAGNVMVDAFGAFGARDYADWSGTLSGKGALLIPQGAKCSLPAARIQLPYADFEDNAVELTLKDASVPFVRFAGTVRLGETGTLKLADAASAKTWPGKRFLLAECGGYDGPADTTGWTFAPAPGGDDTLQGKFVFSNGKLWLRMSGGGLSIIVR